MKSLLLVAVLIVPIFCASTEGLANFENRGDQSCVKDKDTGFFWDYTQKCAPCLNQKSCQCHTLHGCDSCIDGYIYYGEGEDQKSCYQCESDAQSYPATCCIKPISKTQTAASTYAFRDVTCADTGSTGLKNQNFGSYCWQEAACTTLGDQGVCTACLEGYYLDEDNNCQVCEAYKTTADGGGLWGIPNVCTKCTGEKECQQCTPHYYLLTTKTVLSTDYTTDLQDNSSICVECDPYCICTGTFDDQDVQDTCNSCLNNDNYWFDDTDNTCHPCTEIDPFCITCNKDKCLTCSSARALKVDWGYSGYYLPSTDGLTCIQGPDFCHSFVKNEDDSTYCQNEASCDNGTYGVPIQDNATGVTCTKCNDNTNHYARCKYGVDAPDTMIPTMCTYEGSEGAINQQPLWNVPDSHEYFLITKSDDTLVCQENANQCEQMVNKPEAGNEGDCQKCYTDLNWVLDNDNACKSCSTITGCITCKKGETDPDDLQCQTCYTNLDKSTWQEAAKQNYVAKGADDGTCTTCSPGCKVCSAGDTCTTCQASYVKDGDACSKCTLTNCKTCAADKLGECTGCFDSYYLYQDDDDHFFCQPCSSTGVCLKCSSSFKCSLCASGYYVVNGVCVPERANCVQYSTDAGTEGDCIDCVRGYRAVYGFCQMGFQNEQRYVDLDDQCKDGEYYHTDGHWLTQTSTPVVPPTDSSDSGDSSDSSTSNAWWISLIVVGGVAVIVIIVVIIYYQKKKGSDERSSSELKKLVDEGGETGGETTGEKW